MLTYLALGDSYTIGEGVEFEHNFPNQLKNALQIHFNKEIAPPKIIATTGWTTDELLNGIDNNNLEGQFDFTTLLIGVNNQYRGYPLNQYAKEFTSLLYKAILHTHGGAKNVFVISIPDWGKTPFAVDRDILKIEKEIAQYNLLKKTITTVHKAHFIDITPSTIQNGNKAAFVVNDQLHYSALEYKNWVNIIAPYIIQHQDFKTSINR
jgi:lysophospholipase L1-like esterase